VGETVYWAIVKGEIGGIYACEEVALVGVEGFFGAISPPKESRPSHHHTSPSRSLASAMRSAAPHR